MPTFSVRGEERLPPWGAQGEEGYADALSMHQPPPSPAHLQALRWRHVKHSHDTIEIDTQPPVQGETRAGGQHGVILSCRIKETGEVAAMKVVFNQRGPKDVQRELTILSLFCHPRIIGFRGTFVVALQGETGFPGLVMQRADGDLDSYLAERFTRPAAEKWAIALTAARQVAEGLQVRDPVVRVDKVVWTVALAR